MLIDYDVLKLNDDKIVFNDAIHRAVKSMDKVMLTLIRAAMAHMTLDEMVYVFRVVSGKYRNVKIF